MKNRISLFAMLLFIVCMISCNSLQTTTQRPSSSNDRTARQDARKEQRQQLLTDLNLREDQKVEVENIIRESQEQIQALRNGNGDRRSKMQEIRAVSQQTDSQLRKVLDDNQYEIYTAYIEKQREQIRSQMQNRSSRNRRF